MYALVYSIAVNDPTSWHARQCYNQLLYSIRSAHKYAPSLPVKVFMSPVDLDPSYTKALRKLPNVEIVPFVNVEDTLHEGYLRQGHAKTLDHRWRNAFKVFELFPGLDRILYLDTDTLFFDEPTKLFELYPDPNNLYTRKDVTADIGPKLGINYGMNDGQFILSRVLYERYKGTFYEDHKRYIFELLTDAKPKLTDKQYHWLFWLVVQYSAYKLFTDYGVPIVSFSPDHASLGSEPWMRHTQANCGVRSILHHYFAGATPRYLPRDAWVAAKLHEYEKEHETQRPCACGLYLPR